MHQKREREVIDSLLTNDWHLGSELCKAKTIEAMIMHFQCKRLILVGDIFDDTNLSRLKRSHIDVLKRISGLAKHGCEIIWIRGNHDEGLADVYAAFVGAEVRDEYMWVWNGKQFRAIHGDQFDTFHKDYPWISEVAADFYWWLQYILGRYADRICRFFKRHAKGYIKAKKHVAEGALEYAKLNHDDYIICGHTHHVEHRFGKERHYYNSGCATEYPVTCITVGEKGIRVHSFDEQGAEIEVTTPPQ